MLALQDEQIEIVQASFRDVLHKGESFVQSFYDNLFSQYPSTRDYFKHTDFSSQRRKLLMSLVMIIDNLRNPEKLREELQNLGARHREDHHIEPKHYTMVAQTLVKTLAASLTETWTPSLETAWVTAFADVTALMLEE